MARRRREITDPDIIDASILKSIDGCVIKMVDIDFLVAQVPASLPALRASLKRLLLKGTIVEDRDRQMTVKRKWILWVRYRRPRKREKSSQARSRKGRKGTRT